MHFEKEIMKIGLHLQMGKKGLMVLVLMVTDLHHQIIFNNLNTLRLFKMKGLFFGFYLTSAITSF
jgi:hypothetical protein